MSISPNQIENVNCLIIGGGPAGFTAAIYSARARMNPIQYQGPQPGGQLTTTTDVENYPGYPDGVMGPQMMEDFRKQALRFGTDIRYSSVTKVDFSGKIHKIYTDDGKEINAKTVIIATGATAKWLGIESEKKFNGAGVSACAVCDGFFFRGQDIAVVGGGDTAAEEALYLSKLCTKVYLIVRRDQLRASKHMAEKVKNTRNIEILWNHLTEEIMGDKTVSSVRLQNTITKEKKILAVTGFFVAIGHTPNTSLFKDFIELDEFGYIKTKPGTTKTNIKGIFACGDVQDRHYRQAVTAAGTGCMAALEAEKYISE